ncbi:MAG: sugar ABC transporter permease [Propionibacteriaceae bacterium]|nr:sugar ABC transporter permease [Propionibacteriaceae bacterium]
MAGQGVKKRRVERRGTLTLLAFTVPALVLYTIFFIVPALQSVQYALTDWNGYSADFEYVGLKNFTRAIANDNLFGNAVVNNLEFWIVVLIFQTLFALVLAVLLFRNFKGSALLRGLFFFPTILSSVSVAYIWKFIYDPNYGLGNDILGGLGVSSSFLGNDKTAIYWVAVSQVWFHAGQMMTIFIAGLQSVPEELLEAARVDGAGRWQTFKNVTWPMLAPATSIVMAYTTIQSFKAFDVILGLAGNPPKGSMDIMSTRIYTSFANNQYGYASAQAILFVFVIIGLNWAVKRMVGLTQPKVEG